ncbi:MAG: transcription antitermination factor NusB [Bdellovibrionota bacterium]
MASPPNLKQNKPVFRPPRELAIRILTRVLTEGETLDESFARLGETGTSGGRDRAWLLDVCSGVLRWKGRIDLAIDSLALKKKPTGYLRRALQIAFYQLLAQDKADPGGVVFETVDAVKRKDGEAASKFANALLRRFTESVASWRDLQRDVSFDPAHSSKWASLPPWLWDRLLAQRGVGWSEAFARACLLRPEINLRTFDPAFTLVEELAKRGDLPGAWRLSGGMGSVTKLPGFDSGKFIVQDLSSQFLVSEVSKIMKDAGVRTVLDFCAAPGGKSVGLAWNGFQVTAHDRGRERLALLGTTLDRVGLSAQVKISDQDPGPAASFDAIWVDAPCTGTGIIRRHPEIKWNRKEADIASLNRKQAEILTLATQYLKPGGLLVYSVCSVLSEEGPELTASVIKKDPLQSWLLAPQDALGGDWFWAAVYRWEQNAPSS